MKTNFGKEGNDEFETIDDAKRPDAEIRLARINNSSENSSEAPDNIFYFGDYQIISEIARGGMGVVFKARQVSLNRIVAVKMLIAGDFARDEEVTRFYAEAEAAANLDHVGIVPIYEIGQYKGKHYFSMAYIPGGSLSDIIRDKTIGVQEAALFMIKVATAVQYAHERGVIHRDLKPGNVLLSDETVAENTWNLKQGSSASEKTLGHGVLAGKSPKVGDFGLAKRIDGASELTASGQVLGTPSYMPPEQAEGGGSRVGVHSDVYALGAILYCMLAGRPPFVTPNPIETLKLVLTAEPVSLRELAPSVPRDIDTIVLKCLQKEPSRRYHSAHAFADDLNRWLSGDPIQARAAGTIERASRWVRKNAVVTSLSAAIILLTLSVSIISVLFARQASKSSREAIEGSARLDRQLYLSETKDFYSSWNESAASKTFIGQRLYQQELRYNKVAKKDDPRDLEWRFWRNLCGFPASFATALKTSDLVIGFQDEYDMVISRDNSLSKVTFEKPNLRDANLVRTREAGPIIRGVSKLALPESPHSKSIKTASSNGNHIASYESETTQFAILPMAANATWRVFDVMGPIISLEFDSTGTYVVSLSRKFTDNKEVLSRQEFYQLDPIAAPLEMRIWDCRSGELVGIHSDLAGLEDGENAFPTWSRFAINVQIRDSLLDVSIRNQLQSRVFTFESSNFKRGPVASFDITCPVDLGTIVLKSLTGLIAMVDGNDVVVCSTHNHERLQTIRHSQPVLGFTLSPDGKLLATNSAEGLLRIWQLSDGELICQSNSEDSGAMFFNPEGSLLFAGGNIWDVKGLMASSVSHTAFPLVTCSAFSSNNESFFIGTKEGNVLAFQTPKPGAFSQLVSKHIASHASEVLAIACQDSQVASLGIDGTIRVWQMDEGREIWVRPSNGESFHSLAYSRSNNCLVAHSATDVKVWRVPDYRLLHTIWAPTADNCAFLADDSRLWCGLTVAPGFHNLGVPLNPIVFDLKSGKGVFFPYKDPNQTSFNFGPKQYRGTMHTCFSHDNLHFAMDRHSSKVGVFDMTNGELVYETFQFVDIQQLVFSPSGKRLACSEKNRVSLLDVETGECVLRIQTDVHPAFSFSPDGDYLLSSHRGGGAQLLDVHKYEPSVSKP